MKRNPIKHNKKRRAIFHNYELPGTYHITLTVEGRSPVFGRLAYEPKPHIVLSPLGEQVKTVELAKISHYYPNVEVWKLMIMPDHLHMIVRVKAPFPPKKHLGKVVYGFKVGCTRAWWAAGCPGAPVADRLAPACLTPPADRLAPACPAPPAGRRKTAACPGGEPPGTVAAAVAELPVLFEEGYNDGILMRDGQLDGWKHYLDDNPRRLAIKRRNPGFFTIRRDINVCQRNCQMVGNVFLLNIPDKEVVIVHRRDTAEEFAANKAKWLACGERGGVLISAAIAQREKEVMREAMDRGYRIILLRENGFGEYYKPGGEAFDACAAGQLLQLSPWQYHMERRTISRSQCLDLNALAEAIAKDTTWY